MGEQHCRKPVDLRQRLDLGLLREVRHLEEQAAEEWVGEGPAVEADARHLGLLRAYQTPAVPAPLLAAA